MPTFAGRPSTEFKNTGGTSAEFYGWTAKTANIGTAIREIPYSTFIWCGEYDSRIKRLPVLISIGCHVVDQRGGDGGQGDGAPKACHQQAAADFAGGSQ